MFKKGRKKQCKGLPIHTACLTGNKTSLKNIVSSVSRRILETRDSLGRTPLIITVTRNYVDCGAVLLKAGVNVDNTDNAGQTALHIAACQGFYQFVKLLLSYKASWMQRDYFGATALHMAAINPNVKSLAAVIKYVKPAEIDIQDSTLKTALHWSAAYARNDHIKLLLLQGANACIPDEEGQTPLHLAVANSSPGALDCVKTLLKRELSLINWQDYEGRSPVHVAIACGSEEVLYFLASREDCNVDLLDNSFCTPLHCAAKRGFFEKADILLKKRANHLSMDEVNGATPLHYAAYNNHAETVKVFTSKSYINDEPDKYGRSALMWAAIKNADAALNVLAERAVTSFTIESYDKNRFNALHFAAIYGNLEAIEILVNHGLQIDLKDKCGMTPFLKACEFGRSKAAQALLNLGANIDAVDFNLCSALHWCARGGHAYLTQILIKLGADYNIQDKYRMTPLHYASISGDFINCTCVLIESGADPNLVDIEGKTPLHCAVLNKRPGITKYLCEHDSDVNAMFLLEDWITPLDCALLKGNVEIAELLKRYGGVPAENIKEYSAVVIQKWFRRITVKGQSKSAENSSNSPFAGDINSYLLSDEDCIPVSEWLPSFQTYVKISSVYHICKGCFHKTVCKHVCKKKLSQNVLENRAAIIIQRAWRRCRLKKQFARLQCEVSLSFPNEDMRLVEEEFWKWKLSNFYKLLKEN